MAIQRARAGLDELLAAKRALPFQVLTGGDAAFLERHDAFVFDCDGVLYSGLELLDGAAAPSPRSKRRQALPLRGEQQRKSRRTMAAKLGALGLAATPEECVPASFATAAALAARGVTRAVESLVSTFGLDPARTVVVGDRVDTDMALAGRMGCAGLLVLTGCATAADAAALAPGCATTFVASHLGALAGPGALVGEPWTAAPDTVDGVLDALHAAAAGQRGRLALVSSDFVFLGTDATERWDRAAFEACARGRFEKGNGWAYEVLSRRSTARGDVVFFDEDLANANLGACRSTGVLVRDGGRLKVAQ
ncbi:phosphoglycolate phosphatase [Aureococcus anophagefferens]|nr:phosphoglycolate phosphatase [Aureococcus anophagefferens]